MTTYIRAGEITKMPVVTLAGDDIAQVKDIVFDAVQGNIRCFTLAGRGLLAGPLHLALPWGNVHSLGPDAVMVRDANALEEDAAAARRRGKGSGGGDVLGTALTTQSGTRLGTITDAVLATGRTPAVAGYEIDTAERHRILVPVGGPVTVSAERVLVPDATAQHSSGDLEGFGAAAEGLRRHLQEHPQED
ncbi:PRC-barrel domain-containing protein [Streptomyces sp. TRM49041]|uniref:PRC-barrel domain-containing protein n=1 Tax=Streptomyces sp. TRM49041 TaxID=2603216 RepID=UPI0011EBB8CA|nr:PRC-barrel domain-containing protein [Streptomyces sp. TRM49041]